MVFLFTLLLLIMLVGTQLVVRHLGSMCVSTQAALKPPLDVCIQRISLGTCAYGSCNTA